MLFLSSHSLDRSRERLETRASSRRRRRLGGAARRSKSARSTRAKPRVKVELFIMPYNWRRHSPSTDAMEGRQTLFRYQIEEWKREKYTEEKSWGELRWREKRQSPRENLKLSSLRHSRRIYRYNNLDGFILFSQFPLSPSSAPRSISNYCPRNKTVYDGVYI